MYDMAEIRKALDEVTTADMILQVLRNRVYDMDGMSKYVVDRINLLADATHLVSDDLETWFNQNI